MPRSQKIEPKILKGFRDYLPSEMAARQQMLDQIRAHFEKFGFLPLQTPALEYAEILTGKYGAEGDQLLYRFTDQGGRAVALRYDLTVPLARVVAQYQQQFPLPFKRYQIAPVWRAEKPQKGRFREFMQCDVDIIGSQNSVAEIELLTLALTILDALNLKFEMRVSDRRILSAALLKAGVAEAQQISAIQTIDKYDKIGEAGVRTELATRGLNQNQIAELTNFLQITGTTQTIIKTLREYFADYDQALEALNQLETVFGGLKKAGSNTAALKIWPGLARGMDYYTGIIFEAVLTKPAGYGSVLGGGRYDELIGKFTKQSLPALGFSVGIDRLFDALKDEQKINTNIEALILFLDKDDRDHYLKLAQQLRAAGVTTDLYLEDSQKIGKQLAFAEKIGARYALFFGPAEIKVKKINVRDMHTGKSRTLTVREFVRQVAKSAVK